MKNDPMPAHKTSKMNLPVKAAPKVSKMSANVKQAPGISHMAVQRASKPTTYETGVSKSTGYK